MHIKSETTDSWIINKTDSSNDDVSVNKVYDVCMRSHSRSRLSVYEFCQNKKNRKNEMEFEMQTFFTCTLISCDIWGQIKMKQSTTSHRTENEDDEEEERNRGNNEMRWWRWIKMVKQSFK